MDFRFFSFYQTWLKYIYINQIRWNHIIQINYDFFCFFFLKYIQEILLIRIQYYFPNTKVYRFVPENFVWFITYNIYYVLSLFDRSFTIITFDFSYSYPSLSHSLFFFLTEHRMPFKSTFHSLLSDCQFRCNYFPFTISTQRANLFETHIFHVFVYIRLHASTRVYQREYFSQSTIFVNLLYSFVRFSAHMLWICINKNTMNQLRFYYFITLPYNGETHNIEQWYYNSTSKHAGTK